MSSEASSSTWEATALEELTDLAARLECRASPDEPLARHTSMGVGGPCPLMLWPERPAQARALADWMGRRGLRWRVLGGGTNLLVADRGVDEPVLHTGLLTSGERLAESGYRLPAGATTTGALRRSVRAGFDGLVWAAGLPGTIGGAAAGNAGCWGSDMEASVQRVEIVDGAGRPRELAAHELDWAYRRLTLPETLPRPLLITTVEIRVRPDDPERLERRYLELQSRKRERQPVGDRNSGCIFRNPDPERPAGRLLDEAGCKGMRIGGVRVSPVHANFLVNLGGGSCAEVTALIDRIRARVREHSGIDLVPEIRRW